MMQAVLVVQAVTVVQPVVQAVTVAQAVTVVQADRDLEDADELCSYFETFQIANRSNRRSYVGLVALGHAVVRLAFGHCADAYWTGVQMLAVHAVDNAIAARLADDAFASRLAVVGRHSFAAVAWVSSKIQTQ